MCGCTVDYLVPTTSPFGQNCLKQYAGCLEKRLHLRPMQHAQTKYLPHYHVACNKLHHICTNKKDLQLSLFHSLSMKAGTYMYVQSRPYNTLQKTEGPSQTYHQNILCLCTGYPPISIF